MNNQKLNHTEFLKRLVALMPIASPDETRWHLCGVHIKPSEERRELRLEACDGHRMIIETIDTESLPELMSGLDLIIRKNQIPVIKEALKAYGKYSACEIKFERSSLTLIINDQFRVQLEESQSYPNLDRLVPKISKEKKVKIGLNSKYLLEICKALKETAKNPNVTIEFSLNDDGTTLEPMIIRANEKEAVLMPVRVS